MNILQHTHRKDMIVALPQATNEIKNIAYSLQSSPTLSLSTTHRSPTSKGCINTNVIASRTLLLGVLEYGVF
jgi:hypothetical protein